MTALMLEVEVDGVVRRVALERRDEGYVVQMDGRSIPVDVCEPAPGVISLLIRDGAGDGFVGGHSYRCVRTVTADEETIVVDAWQHRVAVNDPRSLRAQRKRPGAGNGTLQIKASMPGRVARVLVTRLGALETDLGVGSQIQLFTLPREVEFVVPAPSAFRCHEKRQALANGDSFLVAHGLDITNVVFGSEADR